MILVIPAFSKAFFSVWITKTGISRVRTFLMINAFDETIYLNIVTLEVPIIAYSEI